MAKHRNPNVGRHSRSQEDQDDALVATAIETAAWAQRNQTLLVVLVIAVVAAVAGLVYYNNYRDDVQVRASTELERIQQVVATGDPQAATTELEDYVRRFDGTPMGGEARLLLGQIHAETGQPEAAVDVLEPIAELSTPIGAQATALLAAVHEQLANWDAAEGYYMRLANSAELDFQVRDALSDAARIRARQGDLEGAIELYDRMIDSLEEGRPERATAEMRRAELQAELNRSS